jgi:hypothetical protein
MTEGRHWSEEVFDEEYARLWSFPGSAATIAEVAALEALLPEPPARVLDVACGIGCHAVALDFRVCDMRYLDLGGFAAALVLGNSFGYHSDRENLTSLRRIADAVVDGGLVIIEVLHRDRLVADLRPHSEHIAGDGTVVRRESSLDPVTGVNTVIHRWTGGDGQDHERRTEQRLYTPPELADLCRAVGLGPLEWRDGLTGGPFHIAARRMLLVASRS